MLIGLTSTGLTLIRPVLVGSTPMESIPVGLVPVGLMPIGPIRVELACAVCRGVRVGWSSGGFRLRPARRGGTRDVPVLGRSPR